MTSVTAPLLQIIDLVVTLGRAKSWLGGGFAGIRAVDGVSLDINAGEIFGLIGESGSGKTTLGRTILGLQREFSGTIKFNGKSVSGVTPREARRIRSDIQYVHQDAAAALDPWWSVGATLSEALFVKGVKAAEHEALVAKALTDVGLDPSATSRFPHEFSGGQLRRLALARILLFKPSLVILDEPTAGLDMSVQATVLRLLLDLRKRFGFAFLFISHDLSVVKRLCDRAAIMHRGKIVEMNDTASIFRDPQHSYTRTLLAAAPTLIRQPPFGDGTDFQAAPVGTNKEGTATTR